MAGETWLLSDPHLGHEFMAQLRGYGSVENHDRAVLQNLRRMVRDGDTVWWLGDIAFGNWQANLQAIETIPGTHRLIIGNHDRCAPGRSNATAHQGNYHRVFVSISQFEQISYNGQSFMLSHYPYDANVFDHDKKTDVDRFAQFRLRDLGVPVIHGHTHNPEQVSFSSRGTPQFNVALEATKMKPVTIASIWNLWQEATGPNEIEEVVSR